MKSSDPNWQGLQVPHCDACLHQHYIYAAFFVNVKISVSIDSKHAIAHNKIYVIDRNIVIMGNFNFTKAAETNNVENLLIIESSELTRIYLYNQEKHRQHSGKATK